MVDQSSAFSGDLDRRHDGPYAVPALGRVRSSDPMPSIVPEHTLVPAGLGITGTEKTYCDRAVISPMTAGETFSNSLGMTFVRIAPGTFRMGAKPGEGTPYNVHHDERPAHEVTIEQSFYVAETPVTNAQFEAFDESHAARRGRRGISTDDDEAAVNVSWHDAVAFCEWLSEREGRPYRLPLEAEWEYACRAGTETPFYTGTELPRDFHRQQEDSWHPTPVELTVGETPSNDWGLRDLHGIVEEWCHDWYGPYVDGPQTDPAGREDGLVKVTRGGSHNTDVAYLRAANRSGTFPEDRNWLIGFRPVIATFPDTDPLPASGPQPWAQGVDSAARDWCSHEEAYFEGPIRFVGEPVDSSTPTFGHNHCPSLTWCENGDLLAVWFATDDEGGREMTILGSRRRAGNDEWDRPSEFFNAPDRNVTGSALFHDPDDGTLYHFNGVGASSHWANLALVLRKSDDDGVTWSKPRFVDPDHGYRNQVISGTIKTDDGHLIQPCDAVSGGQGGTAIHVSPDGGTTWRDPGREQPAPQYEEGRSGGTIAGIHGGIVELDDGRFLALGRSDDVDGRMPRSVSNDAGQTWRYSSSAFPPIGTGQRLVLTRLREGPLLYVGFTDSSAVLDDPSGMNMIAPDGVVRRCYGLFAAVSFDEGDSWPSRRLLSPGDPARTLDGGAWTGEFVADETHGEPQGYLAATQTPDGVVHLLSSALHYQFDVDWLTADTGQ